MSENVSGIGDDEEVAKIRSELANILERLDNLGISFAAIHVATAIDAIDARVAASGPARS